MYHVHIYTYIWCNHTWKHMHANYNVCMCIIVYVHQFPCCDFPPPGSSSMLQTSSHRWSRKRKCWVMTGYFGCTTPWLGLRGRLVEPQPLNVFFCVSEKNWTSNWYVYIRIYVVTKNVSIYVLISAFMYIYIYLLRLKLQAEHIEVDRFHFTHISRI